MRLETVLDLAEALDAAGRDVQVFFLDLGLAGFGDHSTA
jgi:hypothetical protein